MFLRLSVFSICLFCVYYYDCLQFNVYSDVCTVCIYIWRLVCARSNSIWMRCAISQLRSCCLISSSSSSLLCILLRLLCSVSFFSSLCFNFLSLNLFHSVRMQIGWNMHCGTHYANNIIIYSRNINYESIFGAKKLAWKLDQNFIRNTIIPFLLQFDFLTHTTGSSTGFSSSTQNLVSRHSALSSEITDFDALTLVSLACKCNENVAAAAAAVETASSDWTLW